MFFSATCFHHATCSPCLRLHATYATSSHRGGSQETWCVDDVGWVRWASVPRLIASLLVIVRSIFRAKNGIWKTYGRHLPSITQFPIFSKSCVWFPWSVSRSRSWASAKETPKVSSNDNAMLWCLDRELTSSALSIQLVAFFPKDLRLATGVGWGLRCRKGATVDQQHLMLTLRIRENLGHVLWYSPPNLRLPLSNHLVLTGPSQWCSHDFVERRLASAEYTVFRCETSWYHWYHWMIGVFDQSTITSIGIFPTFPNQASTEIYEYGGVNLHNNLPIIVRHCMAHRLPRNLKNLRHIQMSYAGRNALYRFYLS